MSVLRKDPLSFGWVIFTGEPFTPPQMPNAQTPSTPQEECPFCPGREFMTPPEVAAYRPPDTQGLGGWTVRTVPNQAAVLHIEGKVDRRGEGLYDMMNGIGAHEVVIETPDHDDRFIRFPAGKIEEVARMWRDRAEDLGRDPRFRYIQIVRNYGQSAGANLTHPHSQIIALPVIPRVVREELTHAYDYWCNKERCIFCDMLAQDLKSRRVIYENDWFVALQPFASRSSYETWVCPREHASSFVTNPVDLASFADALQTVLSAIADALGNPAYNLIIHSAPLKVDRLIQRPRVHLEDLYHWHLEIVPRVRRIAGFEYGTGFFVNPVLPEDAAEFLRGIIARNKGEAGV